MDIIGASAEDHEIAWWHNGGGNPIVWTKHVISTTALGARSVYPVDIDFDGDTDLVGAAFTSSDVLLFINQGGSPVIFTETVVDYNFVGSHWVHACDIDNDSDIDILGAGYMSDDIAIWYNDGEVPAGWTKFILDDFVNGALSVVASDLNGDDLPDVVAAGDQAGAVIAWYQEDPVNKVFTKEILDQNLYGAWPVHACDMDGDEDNDILSASSTIDDVCWYENLSGTTAIDGPTGDNSGIRIHQVYPNPFREKTTISFSLADKSHIRMDIYSATGQFIRRLASGLPHTNKGGEHPVSGIHSVAWDGKDANGKEVSEGIYLGMISNPATTISFRILKQ